MHRFEGPRDADAYEQELLRPTDFIESDAPEIVRFAQEAAGDARTDVEKGVRIFLAVRDGIRYDPYMVFPTKECYRATTVLQEKAAFCMPKSNLLAAAARALGIPAALGFADVKNHLTTEKLRERMGSDIFLFHGYTLMKLNGKWVKATSAFNIELCLKFGVKPLDFDGESDALFHLYDEQNRKHMEYVNERGCYTDFPFDEVMAALGLSYTPDLHLEDDSGVNFEDEAPVKP